MPPIVAGNNRSLTRSFRLEANILGVLDEEAERMGVSINALVGIILRRYSDFTRYMSKLDMVVVNRDMLTSLFDAIDEESLYMLGMKLGETIPSDTTLFWKKELTEKAVLEYVEKVICRYGQLGTYDEDVSHSRRTIVIRHRLGRKGSKFFEGYLKSGLKHTVGLEATFEVTDSSVKFGIRE